MLILLNESLGESGSGSGSAKLYYSLIPDPIYHVTNLILPAYSWVIVWLDSFDLVSADQNAGDHPPKV